MLASVAAFAWVVYGTGVPALTSSLLSALEALTNIQRKRGRLVGEARGAVDTVYHLMPMPQQLLVNQRVAPRNRSQPCLRKEQIPSPSSYILRICPPSTEGLWAPSMNLHFRKRRQMRSPKCSKTKLSQVCQPFLLHWGSGANGQFAALATKSIRSMDDREPKIVPFAPCVLDVALVNVQFSSIHHALFLVVLYCRIRNFQ